MVALKWLFILHNQITKLFLDHFRRRGSLLRRSFNCENGLGENGIWRKAKPGPQAKRAREGNSLPFLRLHVAFPKSSTPYPCPPNLPIILKAPAEEAYAEVQLLRQMTSGKDNVAKVEDSLGQII